VLIVAGLSLKNLEPRVWDSASPFYLPSLSAVMVSYAEFHQMAARRAAAMRMGLRAFLGVPDRLAVYLDNGAFFFGSQDKEASPEEYEEFVEQAKPDWKPIPRDYIPFPSMSARKQRACYDKTMTVNRTYQQNGYIPVIHIGKYLPQFISCVSADGGLSKKSGIALGGIVPNLLRKAKAIPYADVLTGLRHVREAFRDKSIHVFGVGGTATLHLTALFGFDSVDSSGWRNRAARGIVQLPGCGERLVANLGSWRGRTPSPAEWAILRICRCPACRKHGLKGLKAKKLLGFCCRATHNLWILLEENRWLAKHISAGTYERRYALRLDNSIYKSLINETLVLLKEASHP
jgi:7-cyano-7-deazaguanine tRNA-ribosyltransferase